MLPMENFNAVKEIGGWFYQEDAIILREIDRIQHEIQDGGDLLEVGVYHGKSAAFMGFLIGPQERFYVCDIFEHAGINPDNRSEKTKWYSDIKRRIFEKNYFGIHKTLPMIVACSSGQLRRTAKLGRTFRLIHIDGSHLYPIVRKDLRMAADLLKPGGIVAIDDYRSAHTPGVAAATWEAISEGMLLPVCVTPQKMYASLGRRANALSQQLYEWAETQSLLTFSTEQLHRKRLIKFSAPE